MAAPPILLVADDLALIAAVKRVLAREGYECVLATNAADAVIAFGHSLPGLVLLQPSVESDRGGVVLEELQQHPDTQLLRCVLLGETVPGFAWPVEPLPLDPAHFSTTINETVRAGDEAAAWQVRETAPPAVAPVPAESSAEPEAWRATAPPEVSQGPVPPTEVPEPEAVETPPEGTPALAAPPEPTPPAPTPPDAGPVAAVEPTLIGLNPLLAQPAPEPVAPAEALEDRLFGDLHRDVEAEAMASVESSLPRPDADEELQRLEDEVRAEAQRRRQSREARAATVRPAPPEPPEAPPAPAAGGPAGADEEASFADVGEAAAAPPSRAGELLARAEQMVLEGRAHADARRRADDAERRKVDEAAGAHERRADHAEELVRHEREARAAAEEAQDTLRADVKRLTDTLETERELARVRHENALEALQEQLREAGAQRFELEGTVADLKERLAGLEATRERERDESSAGIDEVRTELATAQEGLETARRERDQFAAALGEARASVDDGERALATLRAERDEATTALESTRGQLAEAHAQGRALEDVVGERDRALAEHQQQLGAELELERQRLAEARGQLEVASRQLDETRAARDAAQAELLAQEAARDELAGQLAEAKGQLESLRADVNSASELLEETARERDGLRAKVAALELTRELSEKLAAELDAEKRARAEVEQERDGLRATLASTSQKAEALESSIQRAEEKVKTLEAREILSVALPGQRTLGLARHGTVGLDGLAQLVTQVVLAGTELRVELGVTGGTRTLWFKRGQIVAAESGLELESLIVRARRDGLIDSRQENELRMMRGAPPREQLEALKARGFIRDIESVPLVQRYTEQVALDAFTEEKTQYRVHEAAPTAAVLLATVPRPTLPMLAESLRRAVPPDALLERLGGGEAVPLSTDSELDLRALGFSERERKMLTWVDGEATVEDLSLASGLKPDAAFRALLVAKWLGIIEVRPGAPRTEGPSGQLDVQRLEAKFDEVQDADYFTILGLPRSAGTEEVRRAFERLAQEFDPLRFSGHPDPALQQRAQVVATLLEEAARALEDDRRRVEYARHLLD